MNHMHSAKHQRKLSPLSTNAPQFTVTRTPLFNILLLLTLFTMTANQPTVFTAAASFLIPAQAVKSSLGGQASRNKSKYDRREEESRCRPTTTNRNSKSRTSTVPAQTSKSPVVSLTLRERSSDDDEQRKRRDSKSSRRENTRAPHTDTHKSGDTMMPTIDSGGDEVVYQGIESAPAFQDAKLDDPKVEKSKVTEKGNRRKKKTKQRRMATTGNIPDVQWRAIPMEHLRHHPVFEPLPHPNKIVRMKALEDVRYFRQESWQWDALHAGRCTTSQAAAALGLLEAKVGGFLGIPRSLRKGGVGAYHRLRQTALRDLDEMERVLCIGGNEEDGSTTRDPLWIANSNGGRSKKTSRNDKGPYPFAAIYLPRITKRECAERRKIIGDHYLNGASPFSARMQWGNAQESTALLTALNYFWKKDPDTLIKEVGMCGAGLEMNRTELCPPGEGEHTGLILGASPDAVILHKNGTLEALEVKNHCPFVPATWGTRGKKKHHGNSNATNHVFRIRELPIQAMVPPAYIPQLMMEMLTLGPNCRSAVMVRQTATNGAVILRLHRDDHWMREMLHFLNRFVADYVNNSVTPPHNFFWDSDDNGNEDCDRYRNFIRRTKEISESVELVDFVRHNEIQRVISADHHHIPLFLD
mmetsp:Transcript_31539/g.94380  ORF Transcript_31539/g.94380 Transcript_31539/m.94380 type:complete len:640 (-) Transcript_31539:54-1973(-)